LSIAVVLAFFTAQTAVFGSRRADTSQKAPAFRAEGKTIPVFTLFLLKPFPFFRQP